MFGVRHGFFTAVFFKSVGVGFLIGVLYLLFMLPRGSGKTNKWVVFAQDILFFLLAAVLSFIFLYDINAGVARLYVFFGEGVGFLLFVLLPGRRITAAAARVSEKIRALICLNLQENKKRHVMAEKNTKKTKKNIKTYCK